MAAFIISGMACAGATYVAVQGAEPAERITLLTLMAIMITGGLKLFSDFGKRLEALGNRIENHTTVQAALNQSIQTLIKQGSDDRERSTDEVVGKLTLHIDRKIDPILDKMRGTQ